jgi:hypothetical protein
MHIRPNELQGRALKSIAAETLTVEAIHGRYDA